MTLDLAAIPFVPAKWYTATSGRAIDLIVVHDMEAPELLSTAEATAHYFTTLPPDHKSSAHYCVDADSIVQCVRDKDVAYHAPGANNNGIGIEHAGYARQSRAEWLDTFGFSMLAKSGQLTATLCVQYHIPVRFVDAEGLLRGERGITTHWEVTKAFHKSTHTDPGVNFPMDVYLALVNFAMPGALIPVVSKVVPMYQPPLSIAGVWQDETGKVLAGVAPDGAVFAWGVQFAGGCNGRSWFKGRTAAGIGPPHIPGKIYTVTATSGEKYALPEATP